MNPMRNIRERPYGNGTVVYVVKVVVGRRRVCMTCPTLEDAMRQRDVLLGRAAKLKAHRRERKARGQGQEVIYFVQAGDDGPVKIGRTKAELVKKRVINLQIANHVELRLLGTIPGNVEIEREVHRRLAAQRIRGEWFTNCETVHALVSGEIPAWVLGPLDEQAWREAA